MTEHQTINQGEAPSRPIWPRVPLGAIVVAVVLLLYLTSIGWHKQFAVENFVAPYQILLSGTGSELDDLEDDFDELSLVGVIPLLGMDDPSIQPDGLFQCINGYVFDPESGMEVGEDYQTRVYETKSGSLDDLVSELADIDGIVAGFNYLTGRDPVPISADPWGVGADPWGVGADPWGVGADPWGVGADPWGVGADPWGVGADPWGVGADLFDTPIDANVTALAGDDPRVEVARAFERTIEEVLWHPGGSVDIDEFPRNIDGESYENWMNYASEKAGIGVDEGDIHVVMFSQETRSEWLRAYGQWLFDYQWATTHVSNQLGGISAPEYRAPNSEDGELESPYVLVGIFDTSPFRIETEGEETIGWTQYDFDVDTENYAVFDIRDHGLFGAGLINRISPDSQLLPYRVLNDGGQGELVVLVNAILNFTDHVVDNVTGKPLAGAVINLSSGVHQEQTIPIVSNLFGKDATDELLTLKIALANAACRGISIVAASGNDSIFRPFGAAHQQLPAAWEFVIGVGASNIDSERSCFSNEADVYAPGGDGEWEFFGLFCRQKIRECREHIEYCVVSIVEPRLLDIPGRETSDTENEDTSDPEETPGFAYWTGTSFSAPLVSGLAARLMEDCPEFRFDQDRGEVRRHIIDMARVGAENNVRIIDIENTLDPGGAASCSNVSEGDVED